VAKSIRATDPRRKRLIHDCRKTKRSFWKNVSAFLLKSRSSRATVNLGKIDKYTEANDTVLVPGKVLSSGELTHPITLAAFSFSKKAFKKVEKVGGTFIFIEELMKRNPTGSKIKLLT
jgi:large subunit ribosomal protein L18e